MLSFFLIPLLGVVWLRLTFLQFNPFPLLPTLGLFYLASFIGWLAVYMLTTLLMLGQRFPSRDTVRVCTSSLTDVGFVDLTPNGARLRKWDKIIAIREDHGDLHFWALTGGHFIPREAWNDPSECQEFFETARTLWKPADIYWHENGAS